MLEIHCKSGKAPFANEDTFDEQFSSATIYVPKGAIGNYKTSAGWCLFNNLVEDESCLYTPDVAYSENIVFSGDTLFCNLTNDEVGQLRASVFRIGKDLNSIKNAVLSGYIDSSDGSFLNALASAYNLSSLDCTNLHSAFANRQFQGCNKLKTIIFSRYWTSTGWYLFEDCVNLENIIFPENHVNGGYTVFDGGSFRGCFSLESIEIPATVNKVKSQCFYCCNNLKKIAVKALTPPDATEDSFGNQFSVAQLIVPKGTQLSYKTAAGWTLFQNVVDSSDDVEIKEDEISENVHFADGVLYANLPYNEVGRLKATVLAKVDDLSQIKTAIISDCIDLKDANFLNALASTYSLSSIDFTELKSDFCNFAFQGCEKLESVKYSKYWSRSGWYLFEGCSALTQVEFPQENDLRTFESGTFRECSSLQKIEIPANVTSIGSQCFYLCRNLKEVNFLGTSIKSIDKGSFKGCYSLEKIMLPSSMSLVGERCFEGCPNIREIHSESTNPPVISENAFNDIYDSAKLYVPVGSREKYATAPVWKNFSSIEEDKTTKLININIETKAFSKSIYTIGGNLIYVGVDADSLKLPAGTYIVKEQNKTKKIIVR